jgi:ABC-type uncharacterized transport system permease subunit
VAVVADSSQFSAMVTEVGDQSYVGTALTMQIAIGFIVAATIWLVPFVESLITWRWAFAVLVPGSIIGIVAMLRPKRIPEATKIAGGLG